MECVIECLFLLSGKSVTFCTEFLRILGLVRFDCDFIMEFTNVKKRGRCKLKKQKLNEKGSEDKKVGYAACSGVSS